MDRIALLAGGGRLPLLIADGVIKRGGRVHIVGIEGEAGADIARFPHTWVNWGQVGRMISVLRAEADAMVIAGSVRRPDLWKLRPDWSFFLSLPQILGMMAGGDDSVLSRVVRFFEAKGIKVRGAHEVAPDLLVLDGPAGALSLDSQARVDAQLGFAVRAALGPLDAGQAVVVADGRVLAIEGAEGTDAMLTRVAASRTGAAVASRSGVLAKGPKPGQELRVDMPAVGPRTIENVAAAGLAGLAVEAGAVLMLDRGEAVDVADSIGIAVEGLAGGLHRSANEAAPVAPSTTASPSPLWGGVRCGGNPDIGGSAIPPTLSLPHVAPKARLRRDGGGDAGPLGRLHSTNVNRSQSSPEIRVVGSVRPDPRALADMEKGVAAVVLLAPFDAGKAVVVARAYVLAIAAAEPALALLERVRALRQWGVGARRRIGVLVCQAGADGTRTAASLEKLLKAAAAAGLAGIAITGPSAQLAAFDRAGAVADGLGLFLVMRETQP
ncbi:MAG TPA: UDP-2,3-diacylglucosamine diphosphatase LpxI [Hyphomicrobiaceae bacterium]|nr:UDP-2,3-diacylglucosamine diphosphatase LpxI [Hyphomicrobiaceae bacterium]